jgi:hypothetical protein
VGHEQIKRNGNGAKEIGSIVQQFIYRLPKKNHDAMMQLEKQFIDIFRKHGGL